MLLDMFASTQNRGCYQVLNTLDSQVCYRKLFRLLVGVGTTGLKVTLPSCCRAVIDNTHP